MESKDSGVSWSAVGPQIDTLKNPVICSLLVTKSPAGTKFFVSTSIPAAIYTCRNLYGQWRKCFSDPLYPDARMPSNREAPLVTEWGNDLIACMYGGAGSPMQRLYFSDNGGLSWRGKECPCEIWGVGVNNADTRTIWVGNFGSWPKSKPYDALQFSPNRGRTWQPVTNCEAQFFWQLQELPDRSLYAATDFGLIRVKLKE